MHATVTLNNTTVALTQTDVGLLRESANTRLIDLGDGLGVDLQAYVPRLGGWTVIATFPPAERVSLRAAA